MAQHNHGPHGIAAPWAAEAGSARSGPNNIGTRPEDVPRRLNVDFGGEGSPTARLWKRYRMELSDDPKHRSDIARRGRESVQHRTAWPRSFWILLQRFIHAPV